MPPELLAGASRKQGRCHCGERGERGAEACGGGSRARPASRCTWRWCGEAGLGRRGDLSLWLDEAAIAGWHAPRRATPGGQPRYSDLAIELVLTPRLVFHLALRQAASFAASVLRLLGVELPVPDHTTLSRRGRAFAGRQPRAAAHGGGEPVGRCTSCSKAPDRSCLGKANGTSRGTADDAAQVPDLLGQTQGTIASVVADGAYDGEPTYAAVAARQPDPPPVVVVPPRVAKATGCSRRSLGETAVGRYKRLVGPKLGARSMAGQEGEVARAVQALNRMIRVAKPVSVRIA